jgi:hypothetical protein
MKTQQQPKCSARDGKSSCMSSTKVRADGTRVKKAGAVRLLHVAHLKVASRGNTMAMFSHIEDEGADRLGQRTFFFSHRHHTIALHARQSASYHSLTATDYGHTMQLLFTHLLRKTSVTDRVKVKGRMGSGDRGLEVEPLFAQLASQFFSPELEPDEKNLGTQSSQEKRARARVDHPPPTSTRSMDELSSSQSRTYTIFGCARLRSCDRIQANAFPIQNARGALNFFSHFPT